MKLKLALRPEWPVRVDDAGKRSVALRDRVLLEIVPLVPIPEEARVWIDGAMARDLPPGASLSDTSALEVKNDIGWPMEIVRAAVRSAAGALAEVRVGAFYKFNEWGAHALVRAADPAALEEAQAELMAVLASGRPEWASPFVIAALAELWT